MTRAEKRNLLAGAIGNTIEFYDFIIYAYLAVFVAEHFFPHRDGTTGLLASYGAFASGMLMRPLGGILFGTIGDRFGRKTALQLSVLLIALPTLVIGLIQGGTGVNVVPAECKVEVDLRVPSPELAEEMTHWFLNLEPIGKDVTLEVTGEMNRPPYQKDAGITSLFGKAQAIYREIGKELQDVPLTGGGSDGNFTAALGIPTLDGLGADGKGAHAAYEQIYYSSLVPRTYLCTRLLETLE